MQAKVKSIYFNYPLQGNSTNYYLILGPRDKAAPPTSQQINKFPPKRVKNLVTPSSIFISSSSTGELCSQPVRGNFRRIGRMFPENVERSFLDPEYSFVALLFSCCCCCCCCSCCCCCCIVDLLLLVFFFSVFLRLFYFILFYLFILQFCYIDRVEWSILQNHQVFLSVFRQAQLVVSL